MIYISHRLGEIMSCADRVVCLRDGRLAGSGLVLQNNAGDNRMISGDGTVFTNRFDYLEVVPGERLVLDHGSDIEDDPARFRVTITLDEQADGKTVLTLRQLHPTAEQRTATIGFGAVELGQQTLDKLARHLEVA